MKLIGLLCFYDERPEELASCVLSLKDVGVEHLVAVDGAYALYPAGEAASPINQHAALHSACRGVGMGLTLHVPGAVWEGNEPEKRTVLFELGWAAARPGDWFVVMDADQITVEWPEDLKQRLAQTTQDVASVTFCDAMALKANNPNWPAYFTVRILFRAQPIRVEGNHFTYLAPDGRVLWAGGDTIEGSVGDWKLNPDSEATSCLDLVNDFSVLHVPNRRTEQRQQEKMDYYVARDDSGTELGRCACGQQATQAVPTNWRLTGTEPIAEQVQVCDRCAKRVRRRNERQLKELGIRVDHYQWVQGKLPEPEPTR